jgi:hypothetical protein
MDRLSIGKKPEKHQESKIKDNVVHVGPSQLLVHSKSTPKSTSMIKSIFQNKIWLIVQENMEIKDAMVDGWIQLLNMLKTMVLLQTKTIPMLQ